MPAADGVLHQELLKLQVVLRHDQVLLTCGDRALRAHDLNGRHSANLCLALGIFKCLLSVCERFLLHAYIL